MPLEEALTLIRDTPVEKNPVQRVSCRKRWMTRTPNHRFNVVAVDFGIKGGLLRALSHRGCNLTVLPYKASVEDILSYHPHGVVISNGPGDPAAISEAVETVKALKGRVPMLGVGLGFDLIGLSYGGKLFRMPHPCHGDHPVRRVGSAPVSIAMFNQSYLFHKESLQATPLEITHVSVPEGWVEGFRDPEAKVLAVLFHAEAAPGPRDNESIFDDFVKMMEENA